jgi:hypothetical protein
MTPEADQRVAVELLHSVDRFFQPLKMIKELKWLRASCNQLLHIRTRKKFSNIRIQEERSIATETAREHL